MYLKNNRKIDNPVVSTIMNTHGGNVPFNLLRAVIALFLGRPRDPRR